MCRSHIQMSYYSPFDIEHKNINEHVEQRLLMMMMMSLFNDKKS